MLVFPQKGELPSAVPRLVRECYEEARRIRDVAPNAFVVQIRRALEALCDDRKVPKNRLEKRLQQLAFGHEIPPVLVEMTHVIRELGNVGAHETQSKLVTTHAQIIDELFRSVVDYVYVWPDRLQKYKNELGLSGKTDGEDRKSPKPGFEGQGGPGPRVQ